MCKETPETQTAGKQRSEKAGKTGAGSPGRKQIIKTRAVTGPLRHRTHKEKHITGSADGKRIRRSVIAQAIEDGTQAMQNGASLAQSLPQ